MPRYDAFGREIGEDTLGGLGSGATAEPAVAEDGDPGATAQAAPTPLGVEAPGLNGAPTPQPVEAPVLTTPQPRSEGPSVTIPLRPPRSRRRRSGRGLTFVLLFVLFIFIAPLVLGAVAIFNTVDDATDATEAVRDGIAGGLEVAPATPAKPAVAPKGVAGRSLVRRANFAAALAKLRGSELRLTSLRLAPERIDAQLLTRGGRLRSQQVLPGGAVKRLGSDSGPGFDRTSTIPFALLNPRAPQRLARRGAAKLGVPVSTLQYLVPTNFGGMVTWAAYFKRARYVVGDAAGRYQRTYP